MARTGRPRLENPRSEGVFIRLTKDEHTDITEYANDHNLTITQTLVQGFYTMVDRDKSEDE
ncbi:MAG: CopG family transcriptional regulator [Lachnospiraceae bacterium]|nr:CopG family transcriptional regulator [Lachnospiraceae bacterium]